MLIAAVSLWKGAAGFMLIFLWPFLFTFLHCSGHSAATNLFVRCCSICHILKTKPKGKQVSQTHILSTCTWKIWTGTRVTHFPPAPATEVFQCLYESERTFDRIVQPVSDGWCTQKRSEINPLVVVRWCLWAHFSWKREKRFKKKHCRLWGRSRTTHCSWGANKTGGLIRLSSYY